MPQPLPSWLRNWVRNHACETDLAGGQCIGAAEILTHQTEQRGQYFNAPKERDGKPAEVEVSVMRDKLTRAQACAQRQGGTAAHPAEVEKAGVRYAVAGNLREKGFAVIHTCGKKGEAYGHVSVVWPDANPLDEPDPVWPVAVQEAFAACFTEQEDEDSES
jgi:hypothetical protein